MTSPEHLTIGHSRSTDRCTNCGYVLILIGGELSCSDECPSEPPVDFDARYDPGIDAEQHIRSDY